MGVNRLEEVKKNWLYILCNRSPEQDNYIIKVCTVWNFIFSQNQACGTPVWTNSCLSGERRLVFVRKHSIYVPPLSTSLSLFDSEGLWTMVFNSTCFPLPFCLFSGEQRSSRFLPQWVFHRPVLHAGRWPATWPTTTLWQPAAPPVVVAPGRQVADTWRWSHG